MKLKIQNGRFEMSKDRIRITEEVIQSDNEVPLTVYTDKARSARKAAKPSVDKTSRFTEGIWMNR